MIIVIFKHLFILCFLLIGIMLGSELMYFVQLDGYSIKSIYKNALLKIKENILNIFMCAIIIFCMLVLDIQNIYLCIVYLLIESSLWLWAGNQFEYTTKIKFTKRLIRQFVLFIILSLLISILILQINAYYLTIMFPLIFFLQYLIYNLDLIILYPVEKFIGAKFINGAKKKLADNNKLIKIGITGSFGKTSTKEILNSILSCEYYTLATPKSYNTPFGISKTINECLENSHEIFICEMGAKKRGEITELCKMVSVDCGIVTAVGRQHLETFGSLENVYKTKKELPDYLYQKFCVFNLMNDFVMQMYKDYLYLKSGVFILQKRDYAKVYKICKTSKRFNRSNNLKISNFYEFPKNNNVYAKHIKASSDCSKFEIWKEKNFVCSVTTELIGIHNIINILLATAMALTIGISPKSIVRGVGSIKSIKARFEKNKNTNGAIIINNGYNSNLDSAPYTLKALKLFDAGNKVVVTPGLVECKNLFDDNYKFGRLLAKYCTEVIIVKKINRNAIKKGLISSGFDEKKIHIVDSFAEVRGVLEKATEDYVILIENDLPDNYK